MTKSLEDKVWREFYIGGEQGVFDIASSSSGIDKNKLNTSSDIKMRPYITRSEINNGINHFISDEQNKQYSVDEGSVITIGLDTQTVFFQPYAFYTGQNIQVLRQQNLNKYTALFIIPLLKVQMKKFNWGGNGATLGRLLKTKVMLPLGGNGKPDWTFMEQHTRDILEKKKKVYKQHAINTLKSLSYEDVETLENKEWKEFFIEDISHILSGKDIYEAERINGNTPYVSSTAKNNGIGYFVGNKNKTLEMNCLSVNRNGSVGYSFFHPYQALFSNDCRKLKLRL